MHHVFNTIQYLERSLSLLITSALDLRTRTIKLCSFSSAYPYKHAVIGYTRFTYAWYFVVRLPP